MQQTNTSDIFQSTFNTYIDEMTAFGIRKAFHLTITSDVEQPVFGWLRRRTYSCLFLVSV